MKFAKLQYNLPNKVAGELNNVLRLSILINCAIEKHVSVKFPKIINSFNVKAQKSLWPRIDMMQNAFNYTNLGFMSLFFTVF